MNPYASVDAAHCAPCPLEDMTYEIIESGDAYTVRIQFGADDAIDVECDQEPTEEEIDSIALMYLNHMAEAKAYEEMCQEVFSC